MKKHFIVIAIILLIVSITLFFTHSEFEDRIKEIDNTLAAIETKNDSEIKIVEELKTSYKNNEVVGLLEIPNESYKAIVTQAKDNDFYLNHDAYKNKNRNGNPFLDYRVDINTDKKILIYGHNSRYVDMPFKVLENYYDRDYFENHKYIKLKTDEKENTYEIFSVYVETSDWSYMKIDFKNDEDWNEHFQKLKNNSIYETGVSVNKNDQILILQTCSTKKEFRKYKKKFLLIISRRVD